MRINDTIQLIQNQYTRYFERKYLQMSKKVSTVKTLTAEQAAAPITVTTPAVIANAMADHHVTTVPDIDANLDEVLQEIKEQTAPTTKAPKVKAPKASTQATAPKNTIKYDLPAIIAVLPDPITPAVLDKAFGLNDGGKTVRRHLRNHFADKMAHNKKDKWEFDKSTSTDIIEYFASRYAFDAAALATVKGVKA